MDPIEIIRNVTRTAAPGPALAFTETHVLKSVRLIGDQKAIGRVKLSQQLGLGEGATRTLLKHLRSQGLVKNTKSGSQLTAQSEKFYWEIKSKIAGPVIVPQNPITLGAHNAALLVKGASGAVKYGMDQRDAAVKLGASGASTLIYTGKVLTMPGVKGDCFRKALHIRRLLISALKPEKGDVIVIGSASTPLVAEISAEAAALETLKQLYREKSKLSLKDQN